MWYGIRQKRGDPAVLRRYQRTVLAGSCFENWATLVLEASVETAVGSNNPSGWTYLLLKSLDWADRGC